MQLYSTAAKQPVAATVLRQIQKNKTFTATKSNQIPNPRF